MNRNVHLEVQGQGCECELGGCGSGTARNKIVMGLLVLSCREWMEHQGGFVSHLEVVYKGSLWRCGLG